MLTIMTTCDMPKFNFHWDRVGPGLWDGMQLKAIWSGHGWLSQNPWYMFYFDLECAAMIL